MVCLLGVRVSLVRCALDGNEDSCVDYLLTYLVYSNVRESNVRHDYIVVGTLGGPCVERVGGHSSGPGGMSVEHPGRMSS